MYWRQKEGGDFVKFCGLLRIYELWNIVSLLFAEDEGDATRIEENKENTQIKIHINDQTEMEIVTQDVDEYNDDENASEKVMLKTEMDKDNSAIETNPDSMETEEPAKVVDDVIAQKSDEILDQGKSYDTFFFLNDLFLYLVIDTVFHPSGIFQNGMEISSKSHV